MLHLDPERLAALADGDPTPDESAHLAACATCAREAAAYRAVVASAAGERNAVLSRPLTDWETLSARLRTEGILRAPARRPLASRPWVRAAAAVLLTLGGAAAGRASAHWPAPAAPSTAEGSDTAAGTATARLASNAAVSDTLVSVEDALRVMRRAANDYRIAAAYIAAHDTAAGSGGADRYRTRLAALDRVNDAVLAAVNEAPTDLVLNQYLLSTRAARAVTLAQLNSSLPPNARLTSW